MKILAFIFALIFAQVATVDIGFSQESNQFNILNEAVSLQEILDFENAEEIIQLLTENNKDEFKLKNILQKIKTKAANGVVDIVLKIIGKTIHKAGYDPYNLENQYFEVPPRGTLELTAGSLANISSIFRYKDVNIKYTLKERKLTVNFPISFKSLKFSYDYHTRVLLTNVRGKVSGNVENLSLNVELNYDFGTKFAGLEAVDMTNTGSMSVQFEGNDRTDWITNEMSSVVTTMLHPVIVKVVEGLTSYVLEEAIRQFNQRVIDVIPLFV